jgi:hypothetical protein
MTTPPTGGDLLQGHWTCPAYTIGGLAYLYGDAPRTREQNRYDNVAGSTSTSYQTHIDETDGPGFVSIVQCNPGSTYGGYFKITIDGTVLYNQTRGPADYAIGLAWLADFGAGVYGPLFFRTSFKFETARTTSSFPFYWNVVYTLLDWN